MYEIFEHTADLGLRIRSADLDKLFEEAACALFSVIVANFDAIRPVEQIVLDIEAERHDELLRDWLAELLYAFHANRMVFTEFDVEVHDGKLTATVRGEPIDLDRHKIDIEIKAVTYHALKVEHDPSGWLAEVIVDV